ncbi:MAG: LapA family protein [Bermanella sp.]
MGWIKSFISLSLSLMILVVGVVINLRNPELVELDIVLWRSAEYSLGLLLVAALFVGCLLGIIANSLWLWQLKRQRNKLKKQLASAVQRCEQLQ